MKIRHATTPKTGIEIENTFVAYDDVEAEIGTASVDGIMRDTLFPSRPHHLLIKAECEPSALFALLGAATARAMMLSRENPGIPARIYTEVDPEDEQRLSMLLAQGYKDDDALIRTAKEVRRGPITTALPKGCVTVKDYLIDETECKYFIERYNAMFSEHVDDKWLRELKKRPDFCRLIAVSQDGLQGELLTWTDGSDGVVGVIQTPPHCQRRGVASHLLDQARQYWADKGMRSAYFDIRTKLSGAMRLAANCGFRPVREITKYPGIDVD